MNMQQILDFQKRIEKGEVDEDEVDSHLDAMGEYINGMSEKGKAIILERMKEENFARLLGELDSVIASSMMSQGCGATLFLAKARGDLGPYVHTIVLSTIAILIEEEIL